MFKDKKIAKRVIISLGSTILYLPPGVGVETKKNRVVDGHLSDIV